MAVALVGSVGTTTTSTTSPITGAYGQTPTGGNLLVAALTWNDNSLRTFGPTASGTWARLQTSAVGNNSSGTSKAGVDAWWLLAAGGDAAPAFTMTIGTGDFTCTIFELSGANTTTPLDTYGVYQSGSTALTSPPTMSPVTSGNIAAAGEFLISAFVQNNQSLTTQTWTELGSGYTNGFTNASTSLEGHGVVNYQALAGGAGATATDSGHFSSGASSLFCAGMVVAVAASGGSPVSPTPAAAAGTGVPAAPAPGIGLHMTIQGA